MNPLWNQKQLREFCKEKGIHVTAYSPLGANGTKWGDNRIVECDVLDEIAKARGKTTAQVITYVHLVDFVLLFITISERPGQLARIMTNLGALKPRIGQIFLCPQFKMFWPPLNSNIRLIKNNHL